MTPAPSPTQSPPPTDPGAATWEGLLATALVGTARRSPPSALDLDIAVHAAEGGDAAATLLAEAAVLSAYRRAGRLPG